MKMTAATGGSFCGSGNRQAFFRLRIVILFVHAAGTQYGFGRTS
jgi:hypothetical protein